MDNGDVEVKVAPVISKKTEKFEFAEGDVKVVDSTPEVLTNDVAITIAPGWSEDTSTFSKASELISSEGRRVISLGYTERRRTIPDNQFPEAELAKARTLLQALEKKQVEKTDVIAHSEGAINILIAAMIDPSRFRNIVLVNPSGFIGKDSIPALAGRFVKMLAQEVITRPKLLTDPVSVLQAGTRTARYIAENPKRTLEELDAITKFDITELIDTLKTKGLRFSVIGSVKDPLYSPDIQIKNMRKTGHVPSIEGFYSVTGGHNDLSIKPEKYALLAKNALDNLEYKRGLESSR